MRAEKAHELPVAEMGRVTFRKAQAGAFDAGSRRDRDVPQRREQRAVTPVAQPVSALAAHAGGFRGRTHAAAAGKAVEEGELAFGSPASATPLGTWVEEGAVALAHRPAWIS